METRVARREQNVTGAPAPQAPNTDAVYVPHVDIREEGERIVLVADLPGADQGSVELKVENQVLTIEAQARVEAPAGYELVGQEYGVGRYRRDFALPDGVSPEGIKARLHHGVLEVSLPKREEEKTRKIKVEM